MSYYILYVLILLIIGQYLTERWLSYLNSKCWSEELPDELKNFYNADKYRLSQRYNKENEKFSMITSSLSTILLLVVLSLGWLGRLSDAISVIIPGPYWTALIFFAILGLASDLLGTPFQWYETFVIEEKYGFNKTSLKTFILDKLKAWLLGLVLGGGILSLIIWIYTWSGQWFFLMTWFFLAFISLIMNMFYSTLIVPLFNRQSPLEDGSLRDKITAYADQADFKINKIFVLDGSKRSSKANAYFSGLGPKKRIVLFDTLMKEHTEEEIVAVIAHEVGHYKKKHTIRNLLISLAESAVFLFLLSLLLNNPSLARALGSGLPSFHLNLLGFALLYSPISFITGLLNHYLSRKYEFEADRFARDTYTGNYLSDALIKLSVNHLSNLKPHPFYVFCYYSHPPLLSRLKAIKHDGQAPAAQNI
ncbi:MAG: M48 family metallopeptidase [Bacteroidales bacterium]